MHGGTCRLDFWSFYLVAGTLGMPAAIASASVANGSSQCGCSITGHAVPPAGARGAARRMECRSVLNEPAFDWRDVGRIERFGVLGGATWSVLHGEAGPSGGTPMRAPLPASPGR